MGDFVKVGSMVRINYHYQAEEAQLSEIDFISKERRSREKNGGYRFLGEIGQIELIGQPASKNGLGVNSFGVRLSCGSLITFVGCYLDRISPLEVLAMEAE